jgi:hypothetical protein
VLLVWDGGVKVALKEFAKSTDNKWDDHAVDLLDSVVKQVLG